MDIEYDYLQKYLNVDLSEKLKKEGKTTEVIRLIKEFKQKEYAKDINITPQEMSRRVKRYYNQYISRGLQ